MASRLFVELLEDRLALSNDFATAIPMTVPGGVDGTIASAGEQWHYLFTAPSTGLLEVRLDAGPGSQLDPLLRVYDGSQNLIAMNDDADGVRDSKATLFVSAGETCFVQASGFSSSTGTFYLTALAQARYTDDFGNATSPGSMIALDAAGSGSQAGVIEDVTDRDMFQFTATRDGWVLVRQDATSGSSLNSFLAVFSSVGVALAVDDDSGGSGNSRAVFQAVAGATYHVRAGNSLGGSTGGYVLNLSMPPDLLATSLSGLPSSARWGDTVTLFYQLNNAGSSDAGPFDVEVRLSADATIDGSDTLLTSFSATGLASGAIFSGSVNITLPGSPASPPVGFTSPDNVFLGLRIDPADALVELYETNNTASAGLTVNVVPQHVDAGTDQTVSEGNAVTFHGDFTDPDANDSHTRAWIVTKGAQVVATGSGPDFTFTPGDDGTYTGTFTVTDSAGAEASDTVVVQVGNIPPVITLAGAATGRAGSPYALQLAATDPGADTVQGWTIHWGDGAVQTVAGNPASVTHVYAAAGQFTISASATDEDGTYTAGNVVSVTVDHASLNQRFVEQVYHDLLGRPTDPGGLAGWAGLLDQGWAPAQVAAGILASPEYRARQVQSLYVSFLHRPADPMGLESALAFLDQGGTLDQVRSGILGSAEYFLTPGGGSNDGYLAALYQDVLGRPIDLSGQQAFGLALAEWASPQAVADAVLHSPEGRQVQVQAMYGQCLHRAADPDGLRVAVDFLLAGGREEALLAALVSSTEFLGGLA